MKSCKQWSMTINIIILLKLLCCTSNSTFAPQIWRCDDGGADHITLTELRSKCSILRSSTSAWAIQSVWWSAIIAYWISLQFPIFSSFLTFAPQFWHWTPRWKKRCFWGGKTPQKTANIFLRLLDTYKKYILQKNWSKTVIPALSSGQHNLHPAIWGCHHQLDDHHRNPNDNNRDHLVGQLTSAAGAAAELVTDHFPIPWVTDQGIGEC